MSQPQGFAPQQKIPATYLRGGTSKGVFIVVDDLPAGAQIPGQARDQLLLRVIGSPDPYGKHTDGMGGGTSSTSKVVLVSKSDRDGYDVDYTFGQVSIDKPMIDWSGNCGNLTAAVGAFAINKGLLDANRVQNDGITQVRIWQTNIQKAIVAHVPMTAGHVQETGDFELDGVAFPAARVNIDFLDPIDASDAMFPTGNLAEVLSVPGIGDLSVTMINAGIPTIFVDAEQLGYTGTELQEDINSDPSALARFESIRAHGAIKMGLITTLEEAQHRQHTPKVAIVAPPKPYVASSGKQVNEDEIDLNVRALSMGKLHHAMMGTAAVAIGTAATIPGTLVFQAAGNQGRNRVTFGHPSGTLEVAATTQNQDNTWSVSCVSMGRSARILMDGWVHVPAQ